MSAAGYTTSQSSCEWVQKHKAQKSQDHEQEHLEGHQYIDALLDVESWSTSVSDAVTRTRESETGIACGPQLRSLLCVHIVILL